MSLLKMCISADDKAAALTASLEDRGHAEDDVSAIVVRVFPESVTPVDGAVHRLMTTCERGESGSDAV
jgi:hypothetical protein